MTGVYSYFQKILKLRNCLGKTKLKLEENLKSIKDMALAPVEISIWETYKISQRELTLVKTKVP